MHLFTFVGDNCYHCQPQAGEGRTEMPSGHLVSLQRKESVKNDLPLLLSVHRIEELATILLIRFHNLWKRSDNFDQLDSSPTYKDSSLHWLQLLTRVGFKIKVGGTFKFKYLFKRSFSNFLKLFHFTLECEDLSQRCRIEYNCKLLKTTSFWFCIKVKRHVLQTLPSMAKQEVGWSNFLRLIFEARGTWKQIQLGKLAAARQVIWLVFHRERICFTKYSKYYPRKVSIQWKSKFK